MAEDAAREDREHEERVRARAYKLWQEEGCPEGRAETHWDKASELVAIEESYKSTLKPNPTEQFENSPTGEPVEPIEAVRNLGEFPTLTDQGEEKVFPDRRLEADAGAPPLKPGRKAAPRAARKT
ncbi:MAG: DUF2934 domain-containing protein [Beijerinckiaceae bacterium]|nr:DUF2934 domain-containing protein [Beijerinckiaceae bacterium]